MSIALIIITRDEERNIKDCIMSCKEIIDEIVIVDDYSKDATLNIAKDLGAIIYQRKLDNFSSQKNFALSKAHCEWVLFLDADERIDKELKKGIQNAIKNGNADGFKILRKNIIFRRLLKFGGNGDDWVLRLFRKDKAGFERPIHEYVVLHGKVARIKEGSILHYSIPDIGSHIKKLNFYTELERNCIGGRKFTIIRLVFVPLLVFIKKYFLQLGFLDGLEGLIYCVLSMFYSYVKYIKIILR